MRLSLTLCIALALAACTNESRKETGGKADGEILPASVNDAMLPRDTVRSQAPLAPKATSAAADKDKVDAASADADPADQTKVEAAREPAPTGPVEPAE